MLDACLLHRPVYCRIPGGGHDQQSADDVVFLERAITDGDSRRAAALADFPDDRSRDNLDYRPASQERLDLAEGDIAATDHQTRLIGELECEHERAHRSSRVLPPM